MSYCKDCNGTGQKIGGVDGLCWKCEATGVTQTPTNPELDIKGTVLRPLADKFQELTRQIDSGEYDLPKTIEEAEKITEGYIDQAYSRLEVILEKEELKARLDELIWATGANISDESLPHIQKRIADLEKQLGSK